MNELTQLQDRVAMLEKFVQDMSFSSSIPRNIQTALEERLGDTIRATGTGSTGGTTNYLAFPVNNVPAAPSGTLIVTVNGTQYELLYK